MPKHATPIKHENGGFTINGCAFHVDPKYEPIDAIGQGSYGVVCSVLNTITKEKVAIKKITPMAGDEWDATHTLREIRLMRCLGEHDNIISLKDLTMSVEKDELYMMMELADTDLHRLIQSPCPLSEGHIRVIMYQLLSGVKTMHDNGVLHRDLKPGNLLINKDCELKITDFGLARMVPQDLQHKDPDSTDTVSSPMTEYVVTRWYRPPELMLAPNGVYDGSVDMWSVGCILGELVARKPLFPGSDFMDQLTRVFKVIEIPPKHKRGYVIEKDALKFLASLPATPPHALEKLCKGKNFSPETKDLMERLLCFNPKERISVDDALRHPFFKGVETEWGMIRPLHLAHSLEFAFEDQSLPLETLRQYIKDEVAAFADKTAADAAAAAIATMAMATDDDDDEKQQTTEEDEHVAPEKTSIDGDFPPGLGFVIKGCEFNVPPKYQPIHVLGEGSYGVVCSATDTDEKQTVAIKKITPMAGDEWDAKHTLREIRLMRYFDEHPNIASLQNLSTCIEKDELYIMMGLVDTDLHRLIQSKTKLEDNHIAAIMYQLLCGAKALHENGVLHRDLKPGNILISKNCDVKITDFGLSRFVPNGRMCSQSDHPLDKEAPQLMTEYVVTRWYRPPEIMLAPNGTYAEAVDMWSIGCIFAELLNRKPLFPGTDFIDQLTRVFSLLPVPPKEKRGYTVEGDALKFLESLPRCSPQALTKAFRKASPEAISLLRRLLCINPQRRITADQALQHPYFKTVRAQLGEPLEFEVSKSFDFEFDQNDLSLKTLRELIQAEVRLFGNGHAKAAVETKATHASHSSGHPHLSSSSSSSSRSDVEQQRLVEDESDMTKLIEPDLAVESVKSIDSCVPETASDTPTDDKGTDERATASTNERTTPATSSWAEEKQQQLQHAAQDLLSQKNQEMEKHEREPTDLESSDDDDEGGGIVVERAAKADDDRVEWDEDDAHDELLEAIQKMNHLSHDHQTRPTRPPSNQDMSQDDDDDEPRDQSKAHAVAPLPPSSSASDASSSSSAAQLPPGWEERFNKKVNRVYYVDLANKTTSWVHPGADKAVLPLSDKQQPPVKQKESHGIVKKGATASSAAVQLPKNWERRADAKVGPCRPLEGHLDHLRLRAASALLLCGDDSSRDDDAHRVAPVDGTPLLREFGHKEDVCAPPVVHLVVNGAKSVQ
ncbi:Aste57867_5594 [Aphanomyces stellatus]|uniref:Aste57867_5594 protein n=1 Tax=Aphanomyces stellatus TaxID=120398 RepID=A0A485KHD5_9STRA|nr:hypothetical protein As57867_005581 [Aphanomyces stellatus]VFT82640.1 Aste57867_5594 [Aphanomyces stellatus]